MKKESIFGVLFGQKRTKNDVAKQRKNRKLLRFENLEDRALLSVSAAEFAQIREAYPDWNLPEQQADINVIEIEADALSVANLKAAITSATQKAGDDLIVVRTTDDANTIQYARSNDMLSIGYDATQRGEISIVALGSKPLTLDANQQGGVLRVDGKAAVNLGNLTLTNGKNAGGIYVNGKTASANVVNCSIINNGSRANGGGIFNNGSLTIVDSEISGNVANGNGGAIINNGSATITNVLFSGNSATGSAQNPSGGAIYNNGSLTATGAEFYENVASANGGALYLAKSATIASGAFAGNSANLGGAIYDAVGSTITNATLVSNVANQGGGIFANGTTFANSIATMNEGGDLAGTIADASADNLIAGYYPGFVEPPILNANGELTNAKTFDLRLRSDSIAIGVGSNAFVADGAVDASGKTRLVGETVDVGAFEYQGDRNDEPISTVVDSLADTINWRDGKWTLREAILFMPEYSTITFAEGLTGTISLKLGELNVDRALSIDGGGAITIDAKGKSRAVYVGAGTAETPTLLNGLTITGGKKASGFEGVFNGGGVYIASEVAAGISNCVITENSADYGAGLANFGGDLTISNVEFSLNSATENGGGIYNVGGALTIVNSEISGNKAQNGGGIYNGSDVAGTLTSCTVAANVAANEGAAIYWNAPNAELTLRNSIVVLNASQEKRLFTVDIYSVGAVYGYDLIAGFADWTASENVAEYDVNKALFAWVPTFDDNFNLTNGDDYDLRLIVNSVALDAGNGDYVVGAFDLRGNDRVRGDQIDLGAHEGGVALLTAPTSLKKGKITSRSIVVNWGDTNEFEDGYVVKYRKVGATKWSELVVGKDAVSATITGLEQNTEYQIRVKALGSGDYADSKYTWTTTLQTQIRLAAPTFVLDPKVDPNDPTQYVKDYECQEGSNGLFLRWQKDWRATSCLLEYRVAGSDDPYTRRTTTTKVAALLLDVIPEKTYEIRVRAQSSGKYDNSDFTTMYWTTARLQTPTYTKAPDVSYRGVLLKWKKLNDANGFTVEYKVNNSDAEYQVAEISQTGQACFISGLQPGTEYSVRIKANGIEGLYQDSEYLYDVVRTKDLVTLATPEFQEISVGTNGIYLKWTSSGASTDEYKIEYKISGSSDAYTVRSIPGDRNACFITDFTPGEKYMIRIQALGSGNYVNSGIRAVVVDTALTALTPKLSTGYPQVGDLGIYLKWGSLLGATGYTVEYKVADSEEDFALAAQLSGTKTNYLFAPETLIAGTEYTIRIQGLGDGEGDKSQYLTLNVTWPGASTPEEESLAAAFADWADDDDDFWTL